MGHSATSVQLQTEESLITRSSSNVKALASLPFSVMFCAREGLCEVSTQCDLLTLPITTHVATQCCLDLYFSPTLISAESQEQELQQCTGAQYVSGQEQRFPLDDKSVLIGIEAVETHLARKLELSSSKDIITDTRFDYIHHDPSIRMECYVSKKDKLEVIPLNDHKNILHKASLNLTTKCVVDTHQSTNEMVTNSSEYPFCA